MLLQQHIKTPAYIYNIDLLEETLKRAKTEADRYGYLLHYAIKANHNPVILSKVREAGIGIDCVSGNEISAALQAGFHPKSVVFAGVGKTDEEINQALQNDIFCLNCESHEELQVIAEIATRTNKIARVALRINPGIEAHTHKNITTGLEENKFGIHPSQLHQALNFCESHQFIEFVGLHFHIGSQILSQKPFIELCKKVNKLWHNFEIEKYGGRIVNMGGGLGIDYADPDKNPIPDFKTFFKIFNNHLDLPDHVNVHFEPGRSLTGQCGSLLTKVLYVKNGEKKKHIITDAGMTELLRPALYQSYHFIENITSETNIKEVYDVEGPLCESTDQFAKSISLPTTNRGDLLSIHSCGAYVESMRLFYLLKNPATNYFLTKGYLYQTEDIQMRERRNGTIVREKPAKPVSAYQTSIQE